MAVVSVTFDGTRYDGSEVNTDWANFPAGGQSPAAEANNVYQGTNAVNQKLSTQSLDGLAHLAPIPANMDAANLKMFYCKLYVTDFGALDAAYGASISIGESQNARHNYNVGGTGAKISRFQTYPAQGGFLIAAVNPSVTGWRNDTVGNPTLAITDFFGAQADWLAAASAKSENFALDAIDVGVGLNLVGGNGADPDGNFTDFVAADQGDKTNGRWGVVTGVGVLVQAQGMLTIGESATACEFTDNDSTVLFLDSYVDTGDFGITVDISNVFSVVNIGCPITGLGDNYTEADTRPDHIVTGASGTYAFTGVLTNHRNVTLTSKCTFGGDISFSSLTQGGAEITGGIMRPNSLLNVAACTDATFGVSSGIHDCTVIQAGAGHAFEIDGDVTITGVDFQAFGADAASDAAVLVDTTLGDVEITLNGTTNLTYRAIGGNLVTITNPKIATLSFNFAGTPPANFEWRLYEKNVTAGTIGTVALAGAESKTTLTDETYNYTYTSDTEAVLQVIADGFEETLVYFTLGDANQTVTANMTQETNI